MLPTDKPHAARKGKGRSLGSSSGDARVSRVSRTQIVYGHLEDPETSGLERGVTYLKLRPGARRAGLSAA